MSTILPNPTGAGYFNAISYGGTTISIEVNSGVSGPLPFGTVVQIEPYTGPGTTNPPTVATCQPSSTTADQYILGVIVGGQTDNLVDGNAVAPGRVAQVQVVGIAQVLCDATTTAGYPLVQSAATAGAAKCTTSGAAPTNGEGIGVALQAVTISSGTALVWALLKPM